MECKCNKEREIATMQAEIKTLFKKADSLSDITSSLHNLDKSQSMMAQLLNNIVEHDKKQDAVNAQITQTLNNVNTNLSELNEGQKQLNSQVIVLEERVDKNEALHNIDMRVLKKKHYKEILSRYVLPTGGLVVIIMQLIQFFLDK